MTSFNAALLSVALTVFVSGFFITSAYADMATISASGGVDASTGTPAPFSATDIEKLAVSDDERIQSNGDTWPNTGAYDENAYIEFMFTPNIPIGSTIQSVSVTHEFYRSGALSGAKLEIWDGTTFTDVPLILPTTTGTTAEVSQVIDLMSMVNTPEQLNDIKIRFLAYRGGTANTKTSHDVMSLAITYDPPAVNNPPVGDDQAVSFSVDDDHGITLTGVDPEGNPLTYTLVDLPAKGTAILTNDQVTYTPNGTLGADTFTFKVSDGVTESIPATVTIDLTHGNIAALEMVPDMDTVLVPGVSTVTITGKDQFGNYVTTDNTTVITVNSSDGVATPASVTLTNGIATAQISRSESGSVRVTAAHGAIVSLENVITFTVPPLPQISSGTVFVPVVTSAPSASVEEAPVPENENRDEFTTIYDFNALMVNWAR